MLFKNRINIKLFLGTSISPMIAAAIFVITGVIIAICKGGNPREYIESLIIIIPASLVSETLFAIPAAVSGLIISCKKITKKSLSSISHSILGGVITMAWSIFIRFINNDNLINMHSSGTQSFPYMKNINDLSIFAISTTGIYVSILLFAPKK